MRVVAEIPHPEAKITVFSWNGKYLVKLERGPYEQTYKISEMDILDEADITRLLDDTFITSALQRFAEMNKSWQEAQQRID
jgi:hypothetical protein